MLADVCWTVKHLQATEAAGRDVRRQAERECMNHVTVNRAPKMAQETPTSTNATAPFYPPTHPRRPPGFSPTLWPSHLPNSAAWNPPLHTKLPLRLPGSTRRVR